MDGLIDLATAARSVGRTDTWEARSRWLLKEAMNLRIRSFQSPSHPRLGSWYLATDVEQHWLECVRGPARQRPRRTR